MGATLTANGWLVDEISGGVAQFATDASGNITSLVDGAGKQRQVAGLFDPTIPMLVLGGDHAYDQWAGTDGHGIAKLYADYGITPYMAINTAAGDTMPGESGALTWAQVKALSDSGAVEILSHGHRHIQRWGRLDTGIRIVYSGASGTATVHITGTPKTLTLTAGGGSEDQAFDLTNAAYDTLAELVAAITANASGKWAATLAPELLGTESSINMLPLVAARSVKAGGTLGYFAAGSGIIMAYSGSAYQSAFARIASGVLEIYLDGVQKSSFNLSNASYDTLAELVAAINAVGVTGLRAALCDDVTDGGFAAYTYGDEASVALNAVALLDLTNHGGLLALGSYIGDGARLGAGLPHSYLMNRQFQASKDTAAANGVTIKNFAQSGGGLAQWHLSGQSQYKSYRMDAPETFRYPSAQWAAIGPDYIRTHYTLNSTNNNAANLIATADAMADSPGCLVDMLCHALNPASPSGVNGYTYADTSSGNKVNEADWIAFLAYVRTLVDAGSLLVVTPEEARKYRKFCGVPQNLVFNPFFRNDGASVLNSSSGFTVPGWLLGTNFPRVTAASISTDGQRATVGKFNFTLNASTNTQLITQALLLEPGQTYQVGARINYASYTSGSGVRLLMIPRMGRWDQQMIDATSARWSSVWAIADNDISMLVSIPEHRVQPPMVRGLVAGTFNISGGSTDTLNIAIDSYTSVAVTLTAGAARTASQIAADINAAFAASGTYTGLQEYWTVASAVGNKIVVKSPYVADEWFRRVSITGNGTATVFGASTCLAVPVYSDMMHLAIPVEFIIESQVIGSFGVMQPYCRKVDLAY